MRNLADFLLAAKDRESCGATERALEGARPYSEVDLSGGVVLVIGAEGAGLRPRVAAACDELVSIPMRGKVESLNASAAAAVLLYAIPRALDTRLILCNGLRYIRVDSRYRVTLPSEQTDVPPGEVARH